MIQKHIGNNYRLKYLIKFQFDATHYSKEITKSITFSKCKSNPYDDAADFEIVALTKTKSFENKTYPLQVKTNSLWVNDNYISKDRIVVRANFNPLIAPENIRKPRFLLVLGDIKRKHVALDMEESLTVMFLFAVCDICELIPR